MEKVAPERKGEYLKLLAGGGSAAAPPSGRGEGQSVSPLPRPEDAPARSAPSEYVHVLDGEGGRRGRGWAAGTAVALLPLALAAAGLAYLAQLPPPEVRMAGFATRIAERSPAQRHNARLAANSLDGAVIPPGEIFSFNGRVKSWSVDAGYVKAPVSYDGELLPAFGGGVCQTSTTLYNAALLAGLGVAERHHHVFAPHYVAPGRDAAVAYPNIDLRLKNPHPFPVRLRASARGDRLSVEVWGKEAPKERYAVEGRTLSARPPARVLRQAPTPQRGRAFARSAGATGFRVVTYRRVLAADGRELRRERLSDDSYPAMPEVIRFADAGGTR